MDVHVCFRSGRKTTGEVKLSVCRRANLLLLYVFVFSARLNLCLDTL